MDSEACRPFCWAVGFRTEALHATLKHLGVRLAERESRIDSGISALLDGQTVHFCPPAGFLHRDLRVAAEPDVGFPPVDADSLAECFRQQTLDLGRFDQQGQPTPSSAIPIAAEYLNVADKIIV